MEWRIIIGFNNKKIRERRKNVDGDYDVIHRETESGLVITNANSRFVSDAEIEGIGISLNSLNTQINTVAGNTYTKDEINTHLYSFAYWFHYPIFNLQKNFN